MRLGSLKYSQLISYFRCDTFQKVANSFYPYRNSPRSQYSLFWETNRQLPWPYKRRQLFTYSSYRGGGIACFFIRWLDKRDAEHNTKRQQIKGHSNGLIDKYNEFAPEN